MNETRMDKKCQFASSRCFLKIVTILSVIAATLTMGVTAEMFAMTASTAAVTMAATVEADNRDKTGTTIASETTRAPQVAKSNALAELGSFDTERLGFEPRVPEGTQHFQCCPFSRSGTSPESTCTIPVFARRARA